MKLFQKRKLYLRVKRIGHIILDIAEFSLVLLLVRFFYNSEIDLRLITYIAISIIFTGIGIAMTLVGEILYHYYDKRYEDMIKEERKRWGSGHS